MACVTNRVDMNRVFPSHGGVSGKISHTAKSVLDDFGPGGLQESEVRTCDISTRDEI